MATVKTEQPRTVSDQVTGEVLTLVPATSNFSMVEYMESISSEQAFANQKALAGAYDKAVDALIGPNDVQKEGTGKNAREFKKKSAWRKLQRHFRIDTRIIAREFAEVNASGSLHDKDRRMTTAIVTVEASAPWGQRTEAIGACSFDEESLGELRTNKDDGSTWMTKGKSISLADMIATAETRATNRAVSNLIAMGEVSAEEINKRNRNNEPGRRNKSGDAGAENGGGNGTTAPASVTAKQLQFAQRLAAESVLTEEQRTYANGKIEAAKKENWDREKFSKFIDLLKKQVDTAKEGLSGKASSSSTKPDAAAAHTPSPNASANTSPTSNQAAGDDFNDESADYQLDDSEDDEDFGF